ncbi:MAG: Anti sigma-E protein RseA, N-terminal domain [Pseudomonadota bacterium]|jgi:negative regulator of sigma E activity
MNSQPSDPFQPAPLPDGAESLSALIDGECQPHELDALLSAGLSQRQAQDLAWSSYLAAGAALRGQGLDCALPPSAEFALRVTARLASEQAAFSIRSGAGTERPGDDGNLAWCLG